MRYKRLFAVCAAIATFTAAVLFVFAFNGRYLILSNQATGVMLFYTEISEMESFSVSYVHSVNKSPVTEYYVIEDTEIYLTAMRFSAFGAGIPEQAGEGQTMRIEEDGMVIDGFSRHIPYLCYFIGRTANHTLWWRGGSIPLDTLDEPGQPVLFTVTKCPRLLMVLKEVSAR